MFNDNKDNELWLPIIMSFTNLDKSLNYEKNDLWENKLAPKRANTWLPKRYGPGNNQENIKHMLHSRSCIQLMIKV